MKFKSLVLKMPDGKPYDRENWLYSFLGHFALPAVTEAESAGIIERFWFGQYEHEPFKRFIRFRYTTNKPEVAAAHFEIHREKNGLLDITDAIDEHGYSASEFLDERFCGDNAREVMPDERRDLIVRLLHTASRLTLHTLSHVDDDGYWHLERNLDQANNPSGSLLDSVFHLLGNTTNYRPIVVEVTGGIVSATQFNILQSYGSNLKQGPAHQVSL